VSGVELQSKSDDYSIDNLDSLKGNGQFTTMQVDKFVSYLKFSNRSGEVNIKNINPGFNSLVLNGQFNNYSLQVTGLSYLFSAKLQSTLLDCPDEICNESFKEKALNSSIVFNKKIGSSGSLSKININCTNCNIDMNAE